LIRLKAGQQVEEESRANQFFLKFEIEYKVSPAPKVGLGRCSVAN
jgi:hypothetical protein